MFALSFSPCNPKQETLAIASGYIYYIIYTSNGAKIQKPFGAKPYWSVHGMQWHQAEKKKMRLPKSIWSAFQKKVSQRLMTLPCISVNVKNC